MKDRTYFSTELIWGLLIVTLVGCSLTIRGKFIPDENDTLQQTNNMVDVEDLGVGFDRIYMDPEDLSLNSVQGRHVRPRVFEFKPDPNRYHTVDIPNLGSNSAGPVRRNMVLGVEAETNPRFEWAENARFVYSANDYRKVHENSFFGSAGVMGIASFGGSASFKNVQEKTQASQNMYVYKDGIFRGYTLDLAQDYSQELTESFKKAVSRLRDPASCRQFILDWGTHYSQSVTMGAKCSYRLTFTQETAGTYYENENQFKAEVSAGIKELEFGFGTSDTQATVDKTRKETKASEVKFVSYGGSGAGTSDFGTWSQHATLNSTLIDANLIPYTELLNSHYFPGDTLIDQKKQALMKADSIYYAQQGLLYPDNNPGNSTAFFPNLGFRIFFVELADLNFTRSELGAGEYNHLVGRISFGWVDALNHDHRLGDIFEYAPFNGLKLRKGEDVKPLPPNDDPRQPPLRPWGAVVLIPQEQLQGASLALEGIIMRQWGLYEYKEFPRLSPSGNGKIALDLATMQRGAEQLVSVVQNDETNSLEIRIQFRVKRIQ